MGNLIGIDLLKLDRDVRTSSERMLAATRALSRGDLDSGRDPFSGLRNVSSKASFVELRELPEDPLVAALRGWIGALTIARVTWEDRVKAGEAWRARDQRSKTLEGMFSPRELFDAILREHAHPQRRRELARELAGAVGNSASLVRRLAERRVEALRLLGTSAEDDRGIFDVTLSDVENLARGVLRETEVALPVGTPEVGWEGMIFEALGRGAEEGWPAALTQRWLSDLFHGSTLVDGLRLDLDGLPEALGATSFCRALGMFGDALVRADAPRDLPFSLARSPLDPLSVRRAVLFAGLPAEAAFARRAQGLGRVVARDQARTVLLALTRSLRVEALRALLSDVLLESPRRTATRGQEESATALGAPLEVPLIGLVPKLSSSDASRFLAICEGIRDRATLRERFDEDWFQNPLAHEALRDEHHLPEAKRRRTRESVPSLLAVVRKELEALG